MTASHSELTISFLNEIGIPLQKFNLKTIGNWNAVWKEFLPHWLRIDSTKERRKGEQQLGD